MELIDRLDECLRESQKFFPNLQRKKEAEELLSAALLEILKQNADWNENEVYLFRGKALRWAAEEIARHILEKRDTP